MIMTLSLIVFSRLHFAICLTISFNSPLIHCNFVGWRCVFFGGFVC